MQDTQYLCDKLEGKGGVSKRFAKLNRGIAEMVEDFSLLGFKVKTSVDCLSVTGEAMPAGN